MGWVHAPSAERLFGLANEVPARRAVRDLAVKGHVGGISRFTSRAALAAYNGTASVEASSGEKKIYRLSRRGNRRLNHAIHMAAITQIRFAGTPGRAYYERKRAEDRTAKEAIRALKRRISDLIYARLVADVNGS